MGKVVFAEFCQPAARQFQNHGESYRVADVQSLDFLEDGSFDLAVSYLNMSDLPDSAANIREIYRVLPPGGRFVVANLHPMRSATGGWQRAADGTKQHVILDRYFGEGERHWRMLGQPFTNFHRSLQTTLGDFFSYYSDTHILVDEFSQNFYFQIKPKTMPTSARKVIVPDGEDCVVHVVSRCVRRAWLCGQDPYTGKDFEHRRDWVQERVKLLVEVFAIEVCAYAIMINHSHFVLWCRPTLAASWSNEDVARRWLRVFGRQGQEPKEEEIQALAADPEKVAVLKERLGSVSWFMRCLNEWIARKANAEDECSGRFWEGRFKCQRLEDDGAVLACMAYVDLNPVRAKVAASLEQSHFTSIYDRLTGMRGRAKLAAVEADEIEHKELPPEGESAAFMLENARKEAQRDTWLSPMKGDGKELGVITINPEGYLELVDWTGRQVAEGKPGYLPSHLCPLLTAMQLDVGEWVATVQSYGGWFHRVVGKTTSMERKAREFGQHWLAGVRASRIVFREDVPV